METMKQAAKALIYDDQGRILVLYRSKTHPHLAHDIDLPGGEIDPGESIEMGLMREILEETGLRMQLEQSQMQHSWRTTWGQKQFLYETVCHGHATITISWEHEAHDWISVEEMIGYPAIDGFMHRVQAWLRR